MKLLRTSMNIDRAISNSKKQIDFEIKFKDESSFMKILGKILFFNNRFDQFTTTLGKTIYFPSKTSLDNSPVSSTSTLLHELVHVSDRNRLTFPLFAFLYLSPQIWFLFFIPLFFISWKIALVGLIFLAPIPAIGRAWLEYRGYCMSMYVLYVLHKQYNLSIDFQALKTAILNQFTSSNYYFMFPFKSIMNKKLNDAFERVLKNKHPFEDKIFDMADVILEKV